MRKIYAALKQIRLAKFFREFMIMAGNGKKIYNKSILIGR